MTDDFEEFAPTDPIDASTEVAPAPITPDEQFLSTTTVAELFEVTPETVRTWIEKGYLRAIKIDKAYRVSRQSLRDFANSRYSN